MDSVGEVQWCGTWGKFDDISCWGEYLDAVSAEGFVYVVDEIVCVFFVSSEGQHVFEPRHCSVGRVFVALVVSALLVCPVCSESLLGDFVHLTRSDLDF